MAFSGSGSGTVIAPYQITTVEQLNEMRDDLSSYFILMNDLDFDLDSSYSDPTTNKSGYITGSGWLPVGDTTVKFTGGFNGDGKTISNLFIDRSGTNYIGLFGYSTTDSIIKNLALADVDVTGQLNTGALAGHLRGTINNCKSSGTVVGTERVGGIVGNNVSEGVSQGTVTGSGSSCNVSGTKDVGGFCGYNYGALTTIVAKPCGLILNCYSTGTVTRVSGGETNIGGFVGNNYRGRIINSFSSGSVEYTGDTNPTDKGFCASEEAGYAYVDEGNFFDTTTSSQTTTTGNAKGRTTAQLKNILCYTNYDYPTASSGLTTPWAIFDEGDVTYSQNETNVLGLDGTNEVLVGSANYATNKLTLSIKFEITDFLTENVGLISWGLWNEDVTVYLRSDESQFSINAGVGARHEVSFPKGMLNFGWHNLIVTMDSTSADAAKVYLDNVFLGTLTCLQGSTNFPMTNDLRFGSLSTSGNIRGNLSEILIYDNVISAESRNTILENGEVLTDLVGRWKCNEGTGTTITDDIDAKNGTIVSPDWFYEDVTPSVWSIDDTVTYPESYRELTTSASTITFTDLNATDDVSIAIYSDAGRTIPVVGSPILTAGGGIATIDLDDAVYYYTASKALYNDVQGSFSVASAPVAVNFTIYMTDEMTPSLEWQTKTSDIQETPSLEWRTEQHDIQKTASLEWASKPEHRFCPNLINFEFDFLTPTIYNSKNTATVSGILHSLTLNMKNTGTSGSTIIELYDDSVLITTKTITADNAEYEDVEYFDMTNLIFPKDTLEVKVTQVADGCSDLKIGVFEMTFPFALEKAFMGNIKDTKEVISINRDYLFKNADYWTIDFNQPLNSVSLVTGENSNGHVVNLTHTVTNGDFYNSSLKMTPYVLPSIEKISIKAKDLNNKNYSFLFYPTVTNHMSDYPFYVYGAIETVEVFTPATYYQYSFDSGSTWSDWEAISALNTMDIDFSTQTEGLKTLTVKYRNATIEFQEDVSIYYITGEISCAMNYVGTDAKLSYTDDVPLDRVEVYYDDILANTFELNIVRDMETVSVDVAAKTISVNAGYVYSDNQTFYFDGSIYNMPTPTDTGILNARYIFTFNVNTKLFEWKIDTVISVSNLEDVKLDGYIIIAIVDVRVNVTDATFVNWTAILSATFSNITNLNNIALNLDSSKEIKLTVIDVAGREKDFTTDYTLTKLNIWRELTVTRDNVEASGYDTTNYPKNLLDYLSSSVWKSDDVLPAWNRYECGVEDKKTLKEYTLAPAYDDGKPKSWKVQGSNNGNIWVDLHEVINSPLLPNFSGTTYTVDSTTAYAFYRIYVTAVVSGAHATIYYIKYNEIAGGDGFAVYSETELLPGELHQSSSLELDIETEDWELDDMNGVI